MQNRKRSRLWLENKGAIFDVDKGACCSEEILDHHGCQFPPGGPMLVREHCLWTTGTLRACSWKHLEKKGPSIFSWEVQTICQPAFGHHTLINITYAAALPWVWVACCLPFLGVDTGRLSVCIIRMGPKLHFYDKYALNFVLPTAAKIPLRIQSVPNCGGDRCSWVRLMTLLFTRL